MKAHSSGRLIAVHHGVKVQNGPDVGHGQSAILHHDLLQILAAGFNVKLIV